MPLVPKRELDQAIRDRDEHEAARNRIEEKLGEAEKRIEELESLVELGREKPVESEISLLLSLEGEIRQAEHPVTYHRYSPDRLQWVLDSLDCFRCRDAIPETEGKPEPPEEKPDPGPPPVKEGTPSEPAVRLVP